MNFEELGRAAAAQAAQVFSGTPPSALPLHRFTHYETAVNPKIARSLKVSLAQGFVNHADMLVE